MSRLNARLKRLEKAQRHSASSVRFIVYREVVCSEGGELRSVPAYATVFNGTAWEQVACHEGETKAAFEARIEAKASGPE